MERKILEAINEMTSSNFDSIKQAQQQYTAREIFDMWLEYEGIIGYTTRIIETLTELCYIECENIE